MTPITSTEIYTRLAAYIDEQDHLNGSMLISDVVFFAKMHMSFEHFISAIVAVWTSIEILGEKQ